MPAGVLRCRELPFTVALEDGFSRNDAPTITTLAKSFADGSRWEVQIQPLLDDISEQQLVGRIRTVALQLEPQASQREEIVATGRAHHLRFAAPGGRLVEIIGGVYGGYLVTIAAAGMPGSETSPLQAHTQQFLASLATSDPPAAGEVPLALSSGSVMIPARAWRFTHFAARPESDTRSDLFALPDLQATLGVRELVHPERCAKIATAEPRAFIDSLALGSLTIDKIDRTPYGLRVTTKDDRPAAYELVCSRGMLLQIMVRAPALSPALLRLLDRAGDSLR